MAFVKIHVAKEDIEHPHALDSVMHNPTARAICRRLSKQIGDVRVWHGHIQIGAKIYQAPPEVDNFEKCFAAKLTVAPFDFLLSNEPIQETYDTPRKNIPKRGLH